MATNAEQRRLAARNVLVDALAKYDHACVEDRGRNTAEDLSDIIYDAISVRMEESAE